MYESKVVQRNFSSKLNEMNLKTLALFLSASLEVALEKSIDDDDTSAGAKSRKYQLRRGFLLGGAVLSSASSFRR